MRNMGTLREMTSAASGVAAGALLCAMSANAVAAPFSFSFTTPNWNYNDNTAVYGSNLTLSLTVDNGASTNASQSYHYGDIKGVVVSAIGGSYTFSSSGITPSYEDKGVAPLVTDDKGVATLSFLVSDPAQAGHIDWTSSASFFQLGQETKSSIIWLPIYSFLQPPYGSIGPGTASYFGGGPAPYNPLPLVSISPAVPEPDAYALALAGLSVIGFVSRRRRLAKIVT